MYCFLVQWHFEFVIKSCFNLLCLKGQFIQVPVPVPNNPPLKLMQYMVKLCNGTCLNIRMQIATSVYANSVPIDIMSTKALRSKSSAMIAEMTEIHIQFMYVTSTFRIGNL